MWPGRKMTQKIAICAPSHNFVGLYLRNQGIYRQSEKNLLNSDISPTCSHNVVNLRLTSSSDLLASLGQPCKFQRVSRLGSVTARHCSSGCQPNCDVEQIYLAGRPSRWSLVHISSMVMFLNLLVDNITMLEPYLFTSSLWRLLFAFLYLYLSGTSYFL